MCTQCLFKVAFGILKLTSPEEVCKGSHETACGVRCQLVSLRSPLSNGHKCEICSLVWIMYGTDWGVTLQERIRVAGGYRFVLYLSQMDTCTFIYKRDNLGFCLIETSKFRII